MTDKIGTENSSGKYGEAHSFDPDFKGPTSRRSCTDILCLLLFFAFLIAWGAVAVISILHGNPNRLLYPTDTNGQVCGIDEPVKDKPFLIFFDLTRCASPKVPFTGCPTPQICVKECPTDNWFYLPGQAVDKSKLYCKYDVDVTSKTVGDLIKSQDCAAYHVHSQSIAKRCVPRMLSDFTEQLLENRIFQATNMSTEQKLNTITDGLKYVARFVKLQQVAEGVVEDIKSLWGYILLGCVVAMVVSFLWIFLLRLIAKTMVWLSLILFTGLCAFGAYFTLSRYLTMKKEMEDEPMSKTTQAFTLNFSRVDEMETTWLVLFFVTITLFLICFLVIIFLRKRITLAVAMINEASKAVGSTMSTLFFPIFPYLLHILFIIVFCAITLLLASAGKPAYRVMCNGDCSCSSLPENSTCDPKTFEQPNCQNNEVDCHFFSYEKDPNITRLHIFNVFMLFWCMFFISALDEMILAGTFSSWYWTFNKSETRATPILNSIGRTFRYHTGTLAFGSLIIAIVRMIRVIFEYIDHKVKKYADNMVVKCISCCCRCCLWMLEKFLRYINRNAYIYCAIYGTNFLTSARKSFSLIMRNILRVVVLDKVTDFLLLIGKLVVTIGMGFLSYFFFSSWSKPLGLPMTNYYLTPVLIISVATYFISSAFFSVYEMAVDTLFFCFLEDCERNDGSAEKPYFMSKSLMKILSKENKTVDGEDKKE